MREIRARVSAQHGIELSNQQIQDLAARRLEAILDPKTVKPSLMDELRRSAGLTPDPQPPEPTPAYQFDEATLYESSGSVVRVIRRLLNPLLNLLFNPKALVQALSAQVRLNTAAAAREAEDRRRQAEWNGLHFEILRRLVVDVARADIERQNLVLQVESLSAKVDFNERRVRAFEQSQLQVRPAPRSVEPTLAPTSTGTTAATTPTPSAASAEPGSAEGTDGGRRRRRRRRGRRSTTGPTPGDSSVPGGSGHGSGSGAVGDNDLQDASESDQPSPGAIETPSGPGETSAAAPPPAPPQIEPAEPAPAPETPMALEAPTQAAVPEPAGAGDNPEPDTPADKTDPTPFGR